MLCGKAWFWYQYFWGQPPSHAAVLMEGACVHFWNGKLQLGEYWFYFDITNFSAMQERA